MSIRIAFACIVLCGFCAVLAGCMGTAAPSSTASPESKSPLADDKASTRVELENKSSEAVAVSETPAQTPIDKTFEARLLEIGAAYSKYKRIGEAPSWAPTRCAAPSRQSDLPLRSRASGDDAHGRKLYYLFLADEGAYRKRTAGELRDLQPVGQVLVKESYVAVATDQPVGRDDKTVKGGDGKQYTMGEKFALFVMAKFDPATPGTHDGWVYGTLTADGKQVTSCGKVESCMGCHEDAVHDHLFGIDKLTSGTVTLPYEE